jgi:ferredoxin
VLCSETMDTMTNVTAPQVEPSVIRGSVMTVILREACGDRLVQAHEGEALLFTLKRAGVPLAAVCGGKGACGTCRVHVPASWRDRLASPSKRELRLLAFTGAADGDRLSCRITLEPELMGLEIHGYSDTKGNE